MKNNKAAMLTLSEKLSQLYYSTGGYWKGMAAIPKLAEAAKVEEEVARL